MLAWRWRAARVVLWRYELKDAGALFICLFFHDVSLGLGSTLEAGRQRQNQRGSVGGVGVGGKKSGGEEPCRPNRRGAASRR